MQPSSRPAPLPGPTGTITFLDGTTPLSSSPVALAPNGFASATLPQTFGTPDPTLTAQATITYTGELVGDLNGRGVQDLLIYNFATPFSAQPLQQRERRLQRWRGTDVRFLSGVPPAVM